LRKCPILMSEEYNKGRLLTLKSDISLKNAKILSSDSHYNYVPIWDRPLNGNIFLILIDTYGMLVIDHPILVFQHLCMLTLIPH